MMPVYENSEADVESGTKYEHTYEMAAGGDSNSYEQPLSGCRSQETPPEELYIEANPCTLPHSPKFGIVTQRGTSSFEKLGKTRSDRFALWVAALTVIVMLCIGACISAVLVCVRAANNTNNYDEDILRLEDEIQNMNYELQQLQMKRSLELRKSLELYEWIQAENGHWYKLFDSRVTFGDAKENCEALGTRLASAGIRDLEIKRDILDALIGEEFWNVWIGLEKFENDHTWVWSDGVESNASNTQWKAGEPGNFNGAERCGHISSSSNRTILDKQCSKIFRYICETRNPL